MSAPIAVSASKFFINRFSNIYPIHIVTLALSVAFNGCEFPSLRHRTEQPRFSTADCAHHERYGSGGQCGFTDPVIAGLESLLSVIQHSVVVVVDAVFFHLLFPALAPRLLSMRLKSTMLMAMWGASLLAAVIVVAGGWYQAWPIGVLHTNPLVRLPEFLAGILAYGIFEANVESITGMIASCRRIIFAATGALSSAPLFCLRRECVRGKYFFTTSHSCPRKSR
ncbi:hypothetical protein [Paraburkholderia sp. 40]|uniref:hypothetical protein n=1 Tax=Paraburkholderia sp. 40 TaxID=2991059 RepID=UPI003D2455C1